ncbi:MAG: cell division protein ZapB [Spirochaetes bacterium]|nr:cell division protein ZapB [Spirochaetota bacterium]MBU0956362.1 cell division protein ZapB [Spirochaetota bacterium]
MISLEQVRALEARVEKAVDLIASLKNENAQLRTHLSAADKRVAELEAKVQLFQQDQLRIEEGIVQALKKLDFFEDAVQAAGEHLQTAAAPSHEAEPAVAPEPAAAAVSDAAEPEIDMFAETEPAAAASEAVADGFSAVDADIFDEEAGDTASADTSQLF